MKAKEIDYELMDEWFYYDETSPSYLRWKKNVTVGFGRIIRKKGDAAGTKKHDGKGYCYWAVHVRGTTYRASRVVWCLNYGSIPSNMVVDHIDRNTSNNQVANLRLVSESLNTRNKTLRCGGNSSGVTGVFRGTSPSGIVFYGAHWKNLDGTNGLKTFSTRKYGEEEAFLLACRAREEAVKRLNEQGAGYTETHGEGLFKSKQQIELERLWLENHEEP